MSAFDFDHFQDRKKTSSSKWSKYGDRDVLPFWVADMDFETAPSIIRRLHERIDAGVLGYSEAPESLLAATVRWLAQQYQWHVAPEWIVFIPAVVGGFNMACRCAGEPGDEILMPTPVYHPFLDAPGHAERVGVSVPLQRVGERWCMDFTALGRAASRRSKGFLFCNPQNPTGRVYNLEELQQLAQFCDDHDLLLCSDEIHCPIVLNSKLKHIPIASLNTRIAQRTITLMAPTKAFNIPGVGCGFAIIPNENIRARFKHAKLGLVPSIGPLAYVATEAALCETSGWLGALLDYLQGNAEYLRQQVNRLPGVSTTPVEGTYLAWIDVRALRLNNTGSYFESHGIGLSDGPQFGGPGFVRFNFGCPRRLLQQGLDRFARAVQSAGTSS